MDDIQNSEESTEFVPEEIEKIVNHVIEANLKEASYDEYKVAQWIDLICEQCMKDFADLRKPFKYVVSCVIMQKNGAGIHSATSCYWDTVTDVSGQVPDEPVVSKLTGHVYERRLIEKYIETEEKCPATGEPMTANDLLPVKTSNAVKPRTITATSIPGLVSLVQNEWDDLMLETFTLKQQLDATRQELSQALYQHDAACRVIARLVKERDSAREQLVSLQQQVASGKASTDMEVEANGQSDGLPAEVVKAIQDKCVELSKKRRQRSVNPDLPTGETVGNWSPVSSHTIHKSDKPGITCVDISPRDDSKILTGGVDKDAKLFNKEKGQVEATLSGHSKKVTRVKFHPSSDLLFTASQDKTVKIWTPQQDSYAAAFTLSDHTAEVTGLAIHPTTSYLATAAKDGGWGLYDISRGALLAMVKDPAVEKGLETLAFHPDGQLMATGTEDSLVRIWDTTTQQNAATFEGHTGPVTSVAFSENGYYMASASNDGIRLWDLRKLQNIRTMETNKPVKAVTFDQSGSYLAFGEGNDIRVIDPKKWTEFGVLSGHKGAVTGLQFSSSTSYLASTSTDRSLKFWQ